MSKVYEVRHNYDNGESYEDYREYVDNYLFSTYERANTFYWDRVTSDYEGKYSLIEWELDTQNQVLLDESVWIKCKSCFDMLYEDYPDCDEDYQDYDQNTDYVDDYTLAELESIQEELEAETEWLTHKGENYENFEQLKYIQEDE